MKVTIKDVAKEAGVATSTVSRVLSNSDRISDDTKERVNEAIKKLNYIPNAMARGLANNRTNILAVVVPQGAENLFENQFFIQAMKGISIYAEQRNYYIMYAFQEDNSTDENWIRRFTDSKLVDGICLLRVSEHDKYVDYLKEIDFPFVIIGRPEEADEVLWVDNDNFKAMYDLVNLLLDRGHKDIAFIGAQKSLNVSIDRLRGYEEALSSRGLKINNNLIYVGKEFNEKCGELAIETFMKKELPTAIVATDDMIAFGVQNQLKKCNLEDISVVGFNNVPLSVHRNPSLASVDINSEKLGYYATKLLINKIIKEDISKNYYIIDTKLVERESLK
ncbi:MULTISPECIES: LacI family DNA-binding transcriptional regulator [Clostridium]|uniref:LacI family DNA-binding transcriptional regulator n=1 Tax=Clostridium cibarium TaxID=2762247 RepID=A0ABR8PVK3_9CLOT|nr:MULTISPECIES: LacI family DNA-binding transcriptional regulator [Clostridium]MBD7912198.1 LacI family DNA-binding transcriptional regulator [Clostridium cibarium]